MDWIVYLANFHGYANDNTIDDAPLSFLIDTTVLNDSRLSPDQDDYDPADYEELDDNDPDVDCAEYFQRYDR